MSKQIIILGAGKIAEVVSYYAVKHCGYSIAAYCVDEAYRSAETFLGKPLIGFERVAKAYPPSAYDMFVAIGYHDLNEVREKKCMDAMNMGYKLVSVISPEANVPENVTTGWNCFIMPPSIIHPCASIGNNVFVWSGSIVGHHSHIGDHCWLTSGCNIAGGVTIGANSFVAVNATVANSITIGRKCFLGANTLTTKNMMDEQVVIAESSKPIKLNSSQFLRLSNFGSL